jgi:16S rRNA (guanine(527)-N(7))-methyltransferase RsmG
VKKSTNTQDRLPSARRFTQRSISLEFGSSVTDLTKEALDGIESVNDGAFSARIAAFATAIAVWGSRMNLMARSSEPHEVAFHIIDSLMPLVLASRNEPGAEVLRDISAPGKRILDFGTGAGLPGLMLAAALPQVHFTLIEARRRKVSFLAVAISEMELSNVVIRSGHQTARDLAPEFDALVSRASGPVTDFYEIAAAALVKDGVAILYANPGQRVALETAERCGLTGYRQISYSLDRDGLKVERVLAVFRRSESAAASFLLKKYLRSF